jgi:dihydroxyacetone kinase
VFAFKYAGAAAERGDALDAVADTARHALENTRSMEPFGPRALPAQQNV